MKNGVIFVNFKNYRNSSGKMAAELAKLLDRKNVNLIVNAVDLKDVIKNVKYSKVFIEYADPVEFGAFTGAVSLAVVKESNAFGVLLNHSEKRIKFEDLKKCVNLSKKYKLKTIVCCANLNEALKISRLKPDFIAIEPPELISGNISISNAKPELIKNSAKVIKNLIVGAGIHNHNDVRKAYEYGAIGVLVSSAIVNSKNPKKKIEELCKNGY
jgi:triosephosphate isomerase